MTSVDTSRPGEPWIGLSAQAQTLAERLRAVAQDQPRTSTIWLSYAQIVEELARVAESGGTPPTVGRLKSLMTPMQVQQFGKLLRDRRNQAGLSRVQLGRTAKISDGTIKFIETARHPPSRATVLRLIGVPELKLTWADVPLSISPAQEPAGDAAKTLPTQPHGPDPRLNADVAYELSLLADELLHHQYVIEVAHDSCRRLCRLCGARSEGAAMDAHQARKLQLCHSPICVGQLASALIQQHPAISEVATAERRSPRTATALTLAEGARMAAPQQFYGCRSGAELAAQLTRNAALPPTPYRCGVASLLLWALALGPNPVEPGEAFNEESAQRLVGSVKRSSAKPSERHERLHGVSQAAAWLLDEKAQEPGDAATVFCDEATRPTEERCQERHRGQHG